MFKINKNQIKINSILAPGLLAILALGLVASMPFKALASSEDYGSYEAYSEDYNETFYSNDYGGTSSRNTSHNPSPRISYVNPNTVTPTGGEIPVVITGNGFVRGSIAKWDGSYRPTTYNGSEFLNIMLSASDLSSPGTHVISVFNPAPGGGNSNGVYFTVNPGSYSGSVLGVSTYKNPSSTSKSTTVKKAEPAPATTEPAKTEETPKEEMKDLTSNILYGANGFFPSSLIGWLVLAIIILLIVILVRKFLGLENKYHSTQMKHP